MSFRELFKRTSTFKAKKQCSKCEGYEHPTYVAPQSSVPNVKYFDNMIISAPCKVYILILYNDLDNSRMVEDAHIRFELAESSTHALHAIHIY